MDGKHESSVVDDLIWDVYDSWHWYRVIRREVMNESWVTTKLEDPSSDVYRILGASNTIAHPDGTENAWRRHLLAHERLPGLISPIRVGVFSGGEIGIRSRRAGYCSQYRRAARRSRVVFRKGDTK
jgi:hypothetical protein